MGPIRQAMEAMTEAHVAFSQHGLLRTDECQVCRRMIDEHSPHADDCPIDGLRHAIRRLVEFQQQVAE